MSSAKKNADEILAQTKAQADQFLAQAKAEADRHASAAQQRVEAANKQYETVQAHLAQISQLLGPGAASLGASSSPALQSSAPVRAVAAAPANGGSGQTTSRAHTTKADSKGSGKQGDGEQEWWTE